MHDDSSYITDAGDDTTEAEQIAYDTGLDEGGASERARVLRLTDATVATANGAVSANTIRDLLSELREDIHNGVQQPALEI